MLHRPLKYRSMAHSMPHLNSMSSITRRQCYTFPEHRAISLFISQVSSGRQAPSILAQLQHHPTSHRSPLTVRPQHRNQMNKQVRTPPRCNIYTPRQSHISCLPLHHMSLHSRWGLALRVTRGTSARTTAVTPTRFIITRISRHAVLQRFSSPLMSSISRIRRRIIPVLTRSRSTAIIRLMTIPTIRYLELETVQIGNQIAVLHPGARSTLRTP